MSWRRPSSDLKLLARLQHDAGVSPQSDAMLAIVANDVAASYDDHSMMYSSEQPNSVVDPELVDAIVRLGGAEFDIRTPPAEEEPKRLFDWDPDPKPDPTEMQKYLVNGQRPIIPTGRAGVLFAVRDYELKQYRDDARHLGGTSMRSRARSVGAYSKRLSAAAPKPESNSLTTSREKCPDTPATTRYSPSSARGWRSAAMAHPTL